MKLRLILFMSLLFSFAVANADDKDDDTRHWAVCASLGGIQPITTLDETSGRYDKAPSTGGPNFALQLEYYIPQKHFSVICGYEKETMDFYHGDVSTDMHNITLGGRWYILPQSWYIQPYIGAATYWNVTSRHDVGNLEASGSDLRSRDYQISRPLLSVAPNVGFDLYIFSSMAIELNYGFRLAIDGHTTANSAYRNDNQTYKMRSPMHRHAFSVGVKLTFPFKFTSGDFSGLLDSLFGIN